MISKNKQHSFLIRIIFLFIIFISLVLAISSYISYKVALSHAKKYLQEITQRVEEDIEYKNGTWDTSKYNADSNIPDVNPLYVITSDGFVIERWKPIHGLLDVADFTRLLAYDKPETIKTETNENWRILSKPIKNRKKIVGVVTVTAYKPEQNNLDRLDQQLIDTTDKIIKQLQVDGDTIDVSNIDERNIPYYINFKVVNRFNKLLYHNSNTSSISRSPSFIDNSYVDNQLKQRREQIIEDTRSHKKYLVLTVPMHDPHASLIGIIVAGIPIDDIYSSIYTNIFIFFVSSVLLAILLYPLLAKTARSYKEDLFEDFTKTKSQAKAEKISFNKHKCQIIIDSHQITVPYASFQYYFCLALFSKPQKRWETDELLDKFGEQINTKNWRKVYDAMTALNKKTEGLLNEKLFIIHNKTFRVNPTLASKIV